MVERPDSYLEWAPDGKSFYFTSGHAEHSHAWRERNAGSAGPPPEFPDSWMQGVCFLEEERARVQEVRTYPKIPAGATGPPLDARIRWFSDSRRFLYVRRVTPKPPNPPYDRPQWQNEWGICWPAEDRYEETEAPAWSVLKGLGARSPDGRWFANWAPRKIPSDWCRSRLALLGGDGTNERVVFDIPKDLSVSGFRNSTDKAIFWSPDSRYLVATFDGEPEDLERLSCGTAVLIDAREGRVVAHLPVAAWDDAPSSRGCGGYVSWSPDSSRVFYAREDNWKRYMTEEQVRRIRPDGAGGDVAAKPGALAVYELGGVERVLPLYGWLTGQMQRWQVPGHVFEASGLVHSRDPLVAWSADSRRLVFHLQGWESPGFGRTPPDVSRLDVQSRRRFRERAGHPRGSNVAFEVDIPTGRVTCPEQPIGFHYWYRPGENEPVHMPDSLRRNMGMLRPGRSEPPQDDDPEPRRPLPR